MKFKFLTCDFLSINILGIYSLALDESTAMYEVITVIEEKEIFFTFKPFPTFLVFILFNVDKYSNNKDIDGYQPILI